MRGRWGRGPQTPPGDFIPSPLLRFAQYEILREAKEGV